MTMTEDESRERIVAQQMHIARECLEDAEAAAGRGSARLAWNRAYYACFHAVTAVFVARNRRFKKHRGIIKAVHEELVPEGVLSAEQAVAFDGLALRVRVSVYVVMRNVVSRASRSIDRLRGFDLR